MPRKKSESQEEVIEAVSADEVAEEAVESIVEAETTAEIDQLKTDLEQAQVKATEYLDGWQRSMAEFANYKKRIEREQAVNQQLAKANVIKRFLELFDDLDRAIKNRPETEDAAGWAAGFELINRKFQSYLQNEGVEQIETQGQFFDPTLHEAISQEDHPDLESGQIIDEVQKGYRIGDRVLRPARVRVAR